MSMLAADRRSARHLTWLACVLAALSGCATWNMPVDTSDTPFRARAITETKRGVQLSATVLDAQDSLRLFGTDVTAAGIQPVWIEVRNDTEQVFWLLRSGTDPDYFSPLEVAWSAHVKLGGDTNVRIDEHFDRLAFPNPIPAHGANSGILFTNPQPVTKLLNVDLLGNKTMVPFTLFLPVRGDVARAGEQIHRYADSEISRYDDLEALRRALESLPCCAGTNAGAAAGDPLNVVLVGDLDDIGAAFVRRGYRRNPTGVGTAQRVFGRLPDLYLLKRAQAGAPANWVRVWRAPINYRGQFVFVAQTGRPIGGRYLPEDARNLRLHPRRGRSSEFPDLGLHVLGWSRETCIRQRSGCRSCRSSEGRGRRGQLLHRRAPSRPFPGHAAADDLRRRSPGLGTAIVRARGRGGAAEGALRWGSLVEFAAGLIAGRPPQTRRSSAQKHGRHC